MKDIDTEAREHAEMLVAYFERIANDNGGEVWQKGLSTAREWLRLINAEHTSQEELLTFIGIVHANRYRLSSGWDDLSSVAYLWIQTKGVPVPSYEDFFASERLPGLYEATFEEQAHALLAVFEKYNKEDPNSRPWENGIEIVQEWLELINTPNLKKTEFSIFIQSVFTNEQTSKIWFETAMRICYWCKENGHIDLIPDNYRGVLTGSSALKRGSLE